MMLRHSREPINGQPVENTFVATDERTGDQLGSCVITKDVRETLFPAQPLRLMLAFTGEGEAMDSLLGAAVARAGAICAEEKLAARIYVECPPGDEALMEKLVSHGFKDTDGLVRVQLRLPVKPVVNKPTGLVEVSDVLDDPLERKYFLERYNLLYNTDCDFAWLKEYCAKPEFMRILTVSQTGMAGEVLTWREGNIGVIGFIETARRWRRLGVAKYMISLACERFAKLGLYFAEMDVQVKIPYLMRLAESVGFKQHELLMRYPGIDINPEE